jgi:hypothetical protein
MRLKEGLEFFFTTTSRGARSTLTIHIQEKLHPISTIIVRPA